MAGVRRGAFTCVGWQVTLCDPIWQVTFRSSEVGIPIGLYLFDARGWFVNGEMHHYVVVVLG